MPSENTLLKFLPYRRERLIGKNNDREVHFGKKNEDRGMETTVKV